jgi:hypothetical protein
MIQLCKITFTEKISSPVPKELLLNVEGWVIIYWETRKRMQHVGPHYKSMWMHLSLRQRDTNNSMRRVEYTCRVSDPQYFTSHKNSLSFGSTHIQRGGLYSFTCPCQCLFIRETFVVMWKGIGVTGCLSQGVSLPLGSCFVSIWRVTLITVIIVWPIWLINVGKRKHRTLKTYTFSCGAEYLYGSCSWAWQHPGIRWIPVLEMWM